VASQELTPEERRTIDIFRRARPSVVFMTSVSLRRDFFTLDVQQIPSGTGSGFVWDREDARRYARKTTCVTCSTRRTSARVTLTVIKAARCDVRVALEQE
jgi:hypothetical protein